MSANTQLLPNAWDSLPTHATNVSIGTHSLFCRISGPHRRVSESLATPVVLLFAGAGDVAASFAALSRLLDGKIRHVVYDRSGLGKSEARPSDANPAGIGTAVLAAKEFCALLDATDIRPPYIVLAHSYGAIVAREFIHLRSQHVVGAVLADPSTEWQYQYINTTDPAMRAVSKGISFAEVTGLRRDSKLSPDEWNTRVKEIRQSFKAMLVEGASYVEVCQTLDAKKQVEKCALGKLPLSVIRSNSKRDYQRIYEAGAKAGNGTEQQRQLYKSILDAWEGWEERMKRDLLGLSSKSRFVEHLDTGHNIHITKPEAIYDELCWVLDNLPPELLTTFGEPKI